MSDSVTRDELVGYYSRPGLCDPLGAGPSAAEVADSVIRWAKSKREPEYHEGQIYQDALGDKWLYMASMDHKGTWCTPGVEREYAYDEPRRPLRLLVPVDNAELHCPRSHKGV